MRAAPRAFVGPAKAGHYVLVASVLLASAAVSSQSTDSRESQPGSGRITFAETIAPIVFDNCASCHRPGEAAPFPLLSYEDVARRGALIAQVTASRIMPPWHASAGYGEFVGERRLTDAQIAAIAAWVTDGMPRGDMARMPPLPVFPADGWRLGEPDLVLEMPAFEVPAGGPDVFRNFVIPTRLAEDTWVRGVEYRPSARTVVHHALFAHVPGESLAARDGADGRPGFSGLGTVGAFDLDGENSRGLGGWAVGATPMFFPEGVAARLPRGADFLLQLHLHPSGKPETEKSLIGIYFAERAPDKALIEIALPALFGAGSGIDIPAGERNYTIRDSLTLPTDVRVYSALAHAHYLARQMRATATLPDGSTRPLLWIDDWDFNWQDSYVYKEPFTLPEGTRIDVTLTYDNSAENPQNPANPPRRVFFGEQSTDEMGAIGFTVEILDTADAPALRQALADRQTRAIAAAKENGTIARFIIRAALQQRRLSQLTIFDRAGAVVSRVGDPAVYSQPTFSPDGSRIAAVRSDLDGKTQDIWVFELATGAGRAITSDTAPDAAPVWSPDGSEIAFVSTRGGRPAVYRRAIKVAAGLQARDGAGAEELLYQRPTPGQIVLSDWSADGRHLTFWSGDAMFLLPVEGDRTPIALDTTIYPGRGGRLSPDGRHLAYNSNQSGAWQAYVRPLAYGSAPDAAGVGEARQISTGGLGGIVWRRDGREIFYLSQQNQTVMAVDIDTSAGIQAGEPRALFRVPTPILGAAQTSSIVSSDGERFVFAVNAPPQPVPPAPASAATPGAAALPGLDDTVIRNLLAGFGGAADPLKLAMDTAAQRLAARPDDPELLAWHGAAVLAWARVANLDVGERIRSFQQSTAAMDRAVAAAPDNRRVRMARGVILQIETPGMPRFANYPGLVENARSDYQRMFDLQKDQLDTLGTHRLGELLQGLGDLYSRQEKPDEAERYYRMITTMLPDTEYASRAAEWMATKQPLPTAKTTCIGCHDTR